MAENFNISKEPQTVAPVCSAADLASLASIDLADTCDCIELRLDQLVPHLDAIAPAIAPLGIPVIATARHPAEGGADDLAAAQRSELYERFSPLVSWIDVEIRSLAELEATVASAQANGTGLIASFHDFEKCPPIDQLREQIGVARSRGADIVKIAVHLDRMSDLFSLAELPQEFEGTRLSLMGMGPLGKLSRLVLAKAGSVLNYGYLTEANAPGQWPASQLKSLIAAL